MVTAWWSRGWVRTTAIVLAALVVFWIVLELAGEETRNIANGFFTILAAPEFV